MNRRMPELQLNRPTKIHLLVARSLSHFTRFDKPKSVRHIWNTSDCICIWIQWSVVVDTLDSHAHQCVAIHVSLRFMCVFSFSFFCSMRYMPSRLCSVLILSLYMLFPWQSIVYVCVRMYFYFYHMLSGSRMSGSSSNLLLLLLNLSVCEFCILFRRFDSINLLNTYKRNDWL